VVGRILSRDDLDELSETATGADDPAMVANELVSVVAGGGAGAPAPGGV
jgi:hypothetical protein